MLSDRAIRLRDDTALVSKRRLAGRHVWAVRGHTGEVSDQIRKKKHHKALKRNKKSEKQKK